MTKNVMIPRAQCETGGPLLKAAADAMCDDATPEEDELLARLETASPEWKSRMAQTLKADTERARRAEQDVSWIIGWIRWPRISLAMGAVALLVVASWLGVRVLRPSSADQLLAQAYTERRIFEVRIPEAKYAPLRVERGDASSNLDKPSSLLKAEALIAENLRRNPNDPAWLEAKARADLLDGHFDSAIQSLQRGLETQPHSTQLLTDLRTAYYLRAKSAEQAIDYGSAIDPSTKAMPTAP